MNFDTLKNALATRLAQWAIRILGVAIAWAAAKWKLPIGSEEIQGFVTDGGAIASLILLGYLDKVSHKVQQNDVTARAMEAGAEHVALTVSQAENSGALLSILPSTVANEALKAVKRETEILKKPE